MKKLLLSVSLVGLGVMGFAQDEMKKVEKEVVEVAAQPDGSIVIEGDNKEESVSLNGEKLIVKGNNIVVHGAGDASEVIVEGDGCQVVVDSSKKIDIKGSKSYVYYRKGEPKTNVSGGSAVQKIDS